MRLIRSRQAGLKSNPPFFISSSLEPVHLRAFEFAVGFLPFQFLTLVELLFAFTDGQRDLHLAVLPEKRQRHERVAFDRGKGEEFPDF